MREDEKDKSSKKIMAFAMAAALIFTGLFFEAPAAYAEEVTVYNANEWDVFKNRTKESIGVLYSDVQNAAPTYNNSEYTSFFTEQPSLVSPYVPGKLTDDTLIKMKANLNFFRWLVGAKPVTTVNTSDELQLGSLVRNWEFAHDIYVESKPDDMPLEMWNEGAAVWHNILAMGTMPSDSINLSNVS